MVITEGVETNVVAVSQNAVNVANAANVVVNQNAANAAVIKAMQELAVDS
jgi:hypothetical protein